MHGWWEMNENRRRGRGKERRSVYNGKSLTKPVSIISGWPKPGLTFTKKESFKPTLKQRKGVCP